MKTPIFVLMFVFCTTCCAQQPGEGTPLAFLQADTDYTIQFPEHLGAFTYNKSSVSYGTISDGQRFPVTTKTALVVSAFTIRDLAAPQWALLEHPASLADAALWNRKLTSAAKLTPESIKNFGSTDEGKARLTQLRKFADAKIETEQTWVNLAHALAISPLPVEDSGPTISVDTSLKKNEPIW